jgi:hypothetical protein
MARLSAAFFLLFFSSCSLVNQQRCRSMQQQGLVQGTLESCNECLDQMGYANSDALNGCSLGLDAAKLMGVDGKARQSPYR